MEFIYLHSIFKDNSVISSIQNCFNNSETPIICYKYNKPIRSTIFNFWERSGSAVECLTLDQRAGGSSLTDVTVLLSLSKTHLS